MTFVNPMTLHIAGVQRRDWWAYEEAGGDWGLGSSGCVYIVDVRDTTELSRGWGGGSESLKEASQRRMHVTRSQPRIGAGSLDLTLLQ